MRSLAPNEVLSLSLLLEMETNGLSTAKVAHHALNDEELKNIAQTGIMATEARIKSLQQFVNENETVGGLR